MLVDELEKEVFNEFMEKVRELDKYNKFKGISNVYELIDRCDELNTSREIYRLHGLSDENIHQMYPNSYADVLSYYDVELQCGWHLRLTGHEVLEEYEEQEKVYTISSFGDIEQIDIV